MAAQQKYKGQFKIVTKSGRTVCYACSKEESEYIVSAGRGRRAIPWSNRFNMYKHV